MKGRPADLPEHIGEENIGTLWQSSCSVCDLCQTFDSSVISSDEVVAKMLQFRRIHKRCDSEEDVTVESYVIEDECTKCGNKSDLGVWCIPKEKPMLFYTFCDWCHADTEGLEDFVAEQMMIALENDSDYEKQPDGSFKFIGQDIED